jgi:hypothetical protein
VVPPTCTPISQLNVHSHAPAALPAGHAGGVKMRTAMDDVMDICGAAVRVLTKWARGSDRERVKTQ